MTDITNPDIAAAHVALEIADGDRFRTDIIVREDEFNEEASAPYALEAALAALDDRWPGAVRPVRVDISARSEMHGLEIDVQELELPENECVTVVVSLSSPYYLDRIDSASVYTDVRRAIQGREEALGRNVYRVIYLVDQEGR